jgi:hypothetical protein
MVLFSGLMAPLLEPTVGTCRNSGDSEDMDLEFDRLLPPPFGSFWASRARFIAARVAEEEDLREPGERWMR